MLLCVCYCQNDFDVKHKYPIQYTHEHTIWSSSAVFVALTADILTGCVGVRACVTYCMLFRRLKRARVCVFVDVCEGFCMYEPYAQA